MENKTYYLDYAATAPMSEAAFQAMLPYLKEHFANPSSVHEEGRIAKMAVEDARKTLSACIFANQKEIYFTSGGTESDNLAIRMGAYSRKHRGKHLITSKIEHPAVLNTCLELEKEGFEISFLPVDKMGKISLSALQSEIREDTILISLMAANHEVGTLQPVKEIGKVAREKGILFHTDAVQGFCHIPMDVNEMGVDLLSASAHKIGGPKGVGFLYVRQNCNLNPMVFGGGQERGLRSGTENVAGIAGFAAAAKRQTENLQKNMVEVSKIRDYMIERLQEKIPSCRLTGDPKHRLYGNIHLRFDGVEAHQLVLELSRKGVYVSAGSACHSHDPRPSQVLKAMGFGHREAYSGLRLSFDTGVTKFDVDEIVKRMEEVCHIG